MDRLLRFIALAFVVMLGGCTAMMESSTYGSNDLYITNNRVLVAQELTARAEAEKAEAEARKAMWEARLAEANYYAATEGVNYSSVLASDYESAYARRLYGFNSSTYRLPASYYNLATSESMRYATAYDPAFYNIMVSGDQVWVEPKYVTSMFGTWGATNVSFGIYSSPWVYGWGVYSSPFYYTAWGYPHYSWYDWNWNMCYNPHHWGYGYYAGCYPHYHSHHHHHHHYYPSRPPQHRPGYKPNGGHVDKYHTNDRRHSSSRYTSPTSNLNYGRNLNGGKVSSTIRNGGATSSGLNNSRVVGISSGSNSSRVTTSPSRGTVQSTGKSSGKSSGSNFRSSSSSSRGTVSNSSSSSSKSSSSSNFRSSSSTSSSRSTMSSSSSSSSSNFRSSGSSSSSRSSSSGATSSRR